jgi:hypothetical protein
MRKPGTIGHPTKAAHAELSRRLSTYESGALNRRLVNLIHSLETLAAQKFAEGKQAKQDAADIRDVMAQGKERASKHADRIASRLLQ